MTQLFSPLVRLGEIAPSRRDLPTAEGYVNMSDTYLALDELPR